MSIPQLVYSHSEIEKLGDKELGPVVKNIKHCPEFLDNNGFVLSTRAFHLYKAAREITDELRDQILESYDKLPTHDAWVKVVGYVFLESDSNYLIEKYIKFAQGETSVVKVIKDLYNSVLHNGKCISIDVQYLNNVITSGYATYNGNFTEVFAVPGYWNEELSQACIYQVGAEVEAVSVSTVSMFTPWGHGLKETGQGEPVISENDFRSISVWTKQVNEKLGNGSVIEWRIDNNQLVLVAILNWGLAELTELKARVSKKKFNTPFAIGESVSCGQVTHICTTNILDSNGKILMLDYDLKTEELKSLNAIGLIIANIGEMSNVVMWAKVRNIPVVKVKEISRIPEETWVRLDGSDGSIWINTVEVVESSSKTKTNLISEVSFWGEVPSRGDGVLIELETILPALFKENEDYRLQRLSELLNAKIKFSCETSYLFRVSNESISNWCQGKSSKSMVEQSLAVWLSHKVHPNLTLVIPGLSSNLDLQRLKKTFYFSQIKRTGNFKFYLEVDKPALVDQLLSCINDGIDGVIINTDVLVENWLGRKMSEDDYPLVLNYLIQIVDLCVERGIDCWAKGSLVVFNPDFVQKLIKARVSGFVSVSSHLPYLITDIVRNEVNLSKNKHREKKKLKI